jgi:hypothetical protein
MSYEEYEGKSDEEINAIERQLFDDYIAADLARTPEERREYHKGARWSAYIQRLRRMQNLMTLGAPDVILASAAFHLFTTAWGLWEQQMGKELTDWFIERSRQACEQCQDCGVDLPMPYTHSKRYCDDCKRKQQELADETLPSM